MKYLDTKEALRVAIANLEAIKLCDPDNYTKELKTCKLTLSRKLIKLLIIKHNG